MAVMIGNASRGRCCEVLAAAELFVLPAHTRTTKPGDLRILVELTDSYHTWHGIASSKSLDQQLQFKAHDQPATS
jgi:hypothetical protein